MRGILEWAPVGSGSRGKAAPGPGSRPPWRLSRGQLSGLTEQIKSGEVDVADPKTLDELVGLASIAKSLTAAAEAVLDTTGECRLFAKTVRCLVHDVTGSLETNLNRLALLCDRPVPLVRAQLVALAARGVLALRLDLNDFAVRLDPDVIDPRTRFYLDVRPKQLERFIDTTVMRPLTATH
jgi:hypothetical protein